MLYLIGLIAFARLITQSQCAQTFYNVGTDLNWQSGNSLILNQGSYADVLRSFKLEKGKLLQFPQAFQFFGQQFQYLIVNSFGTLTFSNVNLADTRGNLMPVEIPISTDSGVDTQQRIPFNNNNVVEEDLEVINRDVLGTDPATEEDVYFIYLGQEATASELADLIRELQELNVTAGFRVTITRIYPELNTLTVRGVSKEALDFIKLNSIVSAVIRNFRTLRTQFIEEASPQDYLNATDRLLFKQTSYTDNRFKTEQVSASWGQDRIDQPFLPLNGQYNIPPATNAGQNVDVYMFDTGLDTVHPEFTTGPFNSVRTVRNVFSSYGPLISDNDVDGHGTHTAGTVGGATVGIAPAANIYGVKVLDNNGVGTLQDILDGFQFVIQQRQVDPNRKIVVSMSLGYGCSR